VHTIPVPGSATRLLTSRTTLGVRDVAASIAFYREALQFVLQTSMGDGPDFAVLARDEVSLGLVRVATPAVAGFACCYLNVHGVESLHASCVRANVKIANPLTRQPWGNYDFVIQDPDGHLIALGEAPEVGH
jgi:predicted enzyme related to lactoylglutathione lyase